jgi:hypothetical protein
VSPELQITPQAPFVHDALEFGMALHAPPQRPQFPTSVFASTHAPEHGVREAAHEIPHLPLAQLGDPFGGAGQTLPQAPQFEVSFEVRTQEPLQSVVPGAQESSHAPSAHTWLAAQRWLHPPQWLRSELLSMQALPQRM